MSDSTRLVQCGDGLSGKGCCVPLEMNEDQGEVLIEELHDDISTFS